MLGVQAFLDSSLVCCPGALKAERNGDVIESAEWSDKLRFDLILNLERDLVVPRVAIKETKQITASCGIHDRIDPR